MTAQQPLCDSTTSAWVLMALKTWKTGDFFRDEDEEG